MLQAKFAILFILKNIMSQISKIILNLKKNIESHALEHPEVPEMMVRDSSG